MLPVHRTRVDLCISVDFDKGFHNCYLVMLVRCGIVEYIQAFLLEDGYIVPIFEGVANEQVCKVYYLLLIYLIHYYYRGLVWPMSVCVLCSVRI